MQGGNRSPGWEEGRELRAWARWWPCSRAWRPSKGPDFGVVQEGDLYRLANTYQALKEGKHLALVLFPLGSRSLSLLKW